MEAEREENIELELLLRTASSQKSTRGGYKVYENLASCFEDGELHTRRIDDVMPLDWESLRGLVLSLSHAPLETDEGFAAFEEKLRALYRRFERDGKMELATRYWINAGRFATH